MIATSRSNPLWPELHSPRAARDVVRDLVAYSHHRRKFVAIFWLECLAGCARVSWNFAGSPLIIGLCRRLECCSPCRRFRASAWHRRARLNEPVDPRPKIPKPFPVVTQPDARGRVGLAGHCHVTTRVNLQLGGSSLAGARGVRRCQSFSSRFWGYLDPGRSPRMSANMCRSQLGAKAQSGRAGS